MSLTLLLNNSFTRLNIFLISILPIGLLVGSLVSNFILILICIFFIFDLIIKKNWGYLNEINFYFLVLINIYLIFNSFLISENEYSILKSLGFMRFILMAYAISYYFKKFDKIIIKIWFVFFLVVCVDLVFEFLVGKNILGFESLYPSRLVGFTSTEHKIGGFYFGFIFLALSFLIDKKNYMFYLFSIIFFIIAILIGERSNFIKIFLMYLIFFIFFVNISLIKKTLIISVLFILSFLIISQIPGLKSKFLNHIYNDNIKSFLIGDNKTTFNDVIASNRHFSHYFVAVEIFKNNKIFGSGFKSFRIESYKEKYQTEIFGASTHPHQFHFELLSELGIVGYLLVLSNLFFVIYRKLKFKQSDILSKCGLIFIIVSMIPILPSGSFFTSYGATIFFINYSFLIRPKFINKIIYN